MLAGIILAGGMGCAESDHNRIPGCCLLPTAMASGTDTDLHGSLGIHVEWMGLWCSDWDREDDTDAINRAIGWIYTKKAAEAAYIPAGIYMISMLRAASI